MFKKILVPTDGSDVSLVGALRALPLAKLAAASVTVVYVQEVYPFAGIGQSNTAGMQKDMAPARAQATAAIERIAEAARAEGVAVESVIAEDDQPARGIVDAADACGADLIVMSSHGRAGVAKLVLGSVATKVLALSAVPVLIVKAQAAEDKG